MSMTEHTLEAGEYHPAAEQAMSWYNNWVKEDPARYLQVRESIASNALSGNRLAQLCESTMKRLDKGKPVSDRYLLGLCWFLRSNFNE